MQIFTILIRGLSLSSFAGCAFFSSKPLPPPVTVPQILDMSKTGVPPEEVVQKMRDSRTVYLQASQLAQLKEHGVPDAVINYMQQSYLDAVRTDQSRADFTNWAMLDDGYMYGGPWWW